MPFANYAIFCEMIDRARKNRFAYPAFNVTSLTTANAVLKGLADSKSVGLAESPRISCDGSILGSGAASLCWRATSKA